MKKIIPFIFTLLIIVTASDLIGQEKEQLLFGNSKLDSLKYDILNLNEKVENLEIEKKYYQTLLQNNNQTYSIIIAIILSISGLISFICKNWHRKFNLYFLLKCSAVQQVKSQFLQRKIKTALGNFNQSLFCKIVV